MGGARLGGSESLGFLVHGDLSSWEHPVCLFDAAWRKRMQAFFEDSVAFAARSR
jgi:hypothetical protein